MKLLLSALSMALLATFAVAEESLVAGGRSPDGSKEVCIVRDTSRELSDYIIQIRPTNGTQPLCTLDDTGGWCQYAGAKSECRALWHPLGSFVVITDRGTKTSSEIYLVDMSTHPAKRLQLPDYLQNALGRVDATSRDIHCFSQPSGWDGDDLKLSLTFSINRPDAGLLRYHCDVVLPLFHGQLVAPYVDLKAVSQPIRVD